MRVKCLTLLKDGVSSSIVLTIEELVQKSIITDTLSLNKFTSQPSNNLLVKTVKLVNDYFDILKSEKIKERYITINNQYTILNNGIADLKDIVSIIDNRGFSDLKASKVLNYLDGDKIIYGLDGSIEDLIRNHSGLYKLMHVRNPQRMIADFIKYPKGEDPILASSVSDWLKEPNVLIDKLEKLAISLDEILINIITHNEDDASYYVNVTSKTFLGLMITLYLITKKNIRTI